MAPLTSAQKRARAITGNESASAYLRSVLQQYGLESLTGWAKEELNKGYEDVVVLQHLRERPEFKARFKAIVEREALGLPAISPAEVIEYETNVRQTMIAAGLPAGFYDQPEDFVGFMTRDLSIEEVKERVAGGYKRVANAPALVRDTFREFFGVDGDNALAAFFLDPSRAQPILENAIATAEIAGTGRRFGIETGQDLSSELARQGVNQQSAEQAFGQLSSQTGLFEENVDEATDLAVDKEGVEAAFGVNQNSRRVVEQRSAKRQAAFAGSGGATQGQRGASGLGEAGT